MIRRPPRSTRTDTLFPYTTLFRSEVGVGVVERLVLEQRGEFRLGFASQARLLLLQALGRDALVLLALGADRVGLGEVDVLALAGVAWMRLLRLPVRRRPRLRARFLLAVAGRLRGLRGLLEAQAEELVAQCVAHGGLRLGG